MTTTQYPGSDAMSHSRHFSNDSEFLDASICNWLDGGLEEFNYKSHPDSAWPTLDDKCPEESYFDFDLQSMSNGSNVSPPERTSRAQPNQKDGESARPHYATEKKYRQRLNDKFKALQTCLTDVDTPLSVELAEEKSKFLEALESGRIGRSVKQRKSLVLALALEYVRSLESRYQQTNSEIENYQQLLFRSAAQLANALGKSLDNPDEQMRE